MASPTTLLHLLTTLLAVTTTVSANLIHETLQGRQANSSGEDAYLQQVCFPPTTSPVVPPCQSILNIESACQPNGTAPVDLLAHAECMCTGSFFPDWLGCLQCDFIHGARSPAVVSAFHTILTSASQALCTGTPTAAFSSLFADINDGFPISTTNAQTTDLYPSQTAVSLYYTPSGSQGPGAITLWGANNRETGTGSATGSGSAKTTMVTGMGSGSGISSMPSATAASTQSTSASKAGAAPTGVWMGALGVMAGGVALVAL